jgi:MFS family permease
VLKLAGDALALGAVIAVMSVPRAAFVERHSPRTVLLLAALVGFDALALPALYAIAAGIGLATAFGYPASSALLPQAISPEPLRPANGALMSLRQATVLVGPMLAGLLVGVSGAGHPGAMADAHGLTLAFAFDALSFIVSERGAALFDSIVDSLRAFWNDRAQRTLCACFAAVSFFVGGAIQVALPVLVDRQLPEGAAALGLLATAHGIGVLVGMILCGALAGFVQVAVFSAMQRRVEPAMSGRAMSVFLFIFLGLAPLSAAAAGVGLGWLAPGALFAASGLMPVVLALLGLAFTSIGEIRDGAGDEPGALNGAAS